MQWADALLMGRVTYDGMSQAWPAMGNDPSTGGDIMNSIGKYVPTSTLTEPTWNATFLSGDVVEAVTDLKAGSENLLIYGSGQLTETLRAAGLIDEYRLLICPIVLGEGRKLFTEQRAEPVHRHRQPHGSVGHGAADAGPALTMPRATDDDALERHVRRAGRPDPPGHPRPAGRGRSHRQRARRALPGDLPAGGQQAPQGARTCGPGDARPQRPAAAGPPAHRTARRRDGVARALPQLLRGVARPAG